MAIIKAKKLYKNDDGVIVPGGSTIPQEWSDGKDNLIRWAYNCGRRGEDYKKKSENAQDAGTLGHLMIQAYLLGKEVPKKMLNKFTQEQIELAETSVIQWMDFEKENEVKLLKHKGKPAIEVELVSKYFGGTIDMIMLVNKLNTLVDLKTGRGVYPTSILQVAGGYSMLADVHGIPWEQILIMHVPSDDNKHFKPYIIKKKEDEKVIAAARSMFTNCLNLNYQKNTILKFLKQIA